MFYLITFLYLIHYTLIVIEITKNPSQHILDDLGLVVLNSIIAMSNSVLCNLPHNLVHGRLTGLHLDSAPSALAQPRLRGCASELMTLGALSRY